MSDEELGLVSRAAAAAGLALGAWLVEAGVAAARAAAEGPGQPVGRESAPLGLALLRAELAEDRRVLRNVGGNLNDVARAANATGEVAAETVAVLGLVSRAVRRVDDTVDRVVGVVQAADVAGVGQRRRQVRTAGATPVATRPSVAARARRDGRDSGDSGVGQSGGRS
jgi:hypothetical protein